MVSTRKFSVVVEKGKSGYLVGYVPELPGCHTQGKTLDELMKNIREAIKLCLEVEKSPEKTEFLGVQLVEVKR